MTTALFSSHIFFKHVEPGHPESPMRLEAIHEVLTYFGLYARMQEFEPRPVTDDQILAVHSPQLLEKLHAIAHRRHGYLDPDTYMNEHSLEAAYMAAGGVVDAVDLVMNGKVTNAFSLGRPPGHHATRDQSMGFCLINNVAIAAEYARRRYKLERILIVDFDVHHGNGTQDIFYESPNVLYFSSHRYPFYPGTGHWTDIGEGEGKGFTVNVPLPQGVGDETFMRIFDQILYPVARRFHPQLVIVSAGYDAHWRDPMGAQTYVSTTGFAHGARVLQAIAHDFCHNRIVYSLEGGYDLEALADSVGATCHILLGDKDIVDPLGKAPHPERDIRVLLDQVRALHQLG